MQRHPINRSRREFFQLAGLGTLGFALAPAFRPAEASPALLSAARSRICQAEVDLDAILDQIETVGLDFDDPNPPFSTAQVDAFRTQALDTVLSLSDDLRIYPREILEQVAPTEYLPVLEMARSQNVALLAPRVELEASLFAPVALAPVHGSLGYVIIDIILQAALGLDPDESKQVLGSGILDQLKQWIRKVWQALRRRGRGWWRRLKRALKRLLKALFRILRRLGNRVGAKLLRKILKRLIPGFNIASAVLDVLFAILNPGNWAKLRLHW